MPIPQDCACCKAELIIFELTENMAVAEDPDSEDGIRRRHGQADAKVLGFYRGETPVDTDLPEEEQTVEIHDTFGLFSLPEKGTRGVAAYNDVDDRYELISLAPLVTRAFRLQTELAKYSDEGATAEWLRWNPADHEGYGGFESLDPAETFTVFDWRRVGYEGDAGTYGAAEMRWADGQIEGGYQSEPLLVGVICDLACPGDDYQGYSSP